MTLVLEAFLVVVLLVVIANLVLLTIELWREMGDRP